jgi:hypothetical protein
VIAPLLLCAFLAVLAPDQTDQPTEEKPVVTLKLSDGTVLIGRIVSEADGKLRIKTDLIGELDLDSESVVERTNGLATHEAAPPAVTPPEAVPTAPSAPTAAVTWMRTLGIGGSFVSAPYEQGQIDDEHPFTGKALGLPGQQVQAQVTLLLMRNSARDRWVLDSSLTYVNAEPAGRLTEAFKTNLHYTRLFHGRDFVFSSTAFKRDTVRNIDNSLVQIFGIGRRVIDAPTKKLELLPGVAIQREEKGTIYDHDVLFGYGFLESFTYTNPRGAGFEQRLTVKTLFEDADLFTINSYVGVRAPLTKRVALQVGVQFDHDEMLGLQQTVLPGTDIVLFANEKSSLQLTTGLQMSF